MRAWSVRCLHPCGDADRLPNAYSSPEYRPVERFYQSQSDESGSGCTWSKSQCVSCWFNSRPDTASLHRFPANCFLAPIRFVMRVSYRDKECRGDKIPSAGLACAISAISPTRYRSTSYCGSTYLLYFDPFEDTALENQGSSFLGNIWLSSSPGCTETHLYRSGAPREPNNTLTSKQPPSILEP